MNYVLDRSHEVVISWWQLHQQPKSKYLCLYKPSRPRAVGKRLANEVTSSLSTIDFVPFGTFFLTKFTLIIKNI